MNFEKLWVIASDVYRKTVKSPSFLIGVFMPFIVVLVGFLIGATSLAGCISSATWSDVNLYSPALSEVCKLFSACWRLANRGFGRLFDRCDHG